MKRLSEKEKREICLQFYSGEKTKSELARRFQVSHTAISKILNDEKVSNSFKKFSVETSNECVLSMIAFMESKNGQAQEIISAIMDELQSTVIERMKKSSLKDCVNAIESLSKTFTFKGDDEKNGKDALEALVSAIKGVSKDE